MKILLVNKFHYFKGGSETYYFNLAEGLRKLGHEVIFFAMENPRNEPCNQAKYFVSLRDYNGKTSVMQKIRDAKSIVYSREAKEKFEALLQAEKPDVIHLNLTHRQITFSILDAPSAKGVPVFYTAHDYVPVCPNGVMLDNEGNVCDACLGGNFKYCFKKKCVKSSFAKSALATIEANSIKKHGSYRKIDRVIAPSDFMRQKLIEGGFPSSQVIIMRNFANNESLLFAKENIDYTDREHPFFIFFGRLSREKGIDLLIDAFLSIVNKLPKDWHLVIVGDGPEKENILDQLSHEPCSDKVSVIGYKQGKDLQQYVERASLAIVSSRCRENMPYSIIESFALGTPVIGARIGGIPELVQQERTGFICEPDNADSLSASIMASIEFYNSEEKYRQMQMNCREYVLSHCLQESYINNLTMLYEQLIEKKQETH